MRIKVQSRQGRGAPPARPLLSTRQRYCLAAVAGGGAAVGANLGDVLAAVAAVDRTLTEREVRMLLGSLLATGLVELSGVDRARYVITPKGLEVLEA
jgi:hypothetical protein